MTYPRQVQPLCLDLLEGSRVQEFELYADGKGKANSAERSEYETERNLPQTCSTALRLPRFSDDERTNRNGCSHYRRYHRE